jgi:hypothetical protein
MSTTTPVRPHRGRIVFPKSRDEIVQMKDYLKNFRRTLRSVIDFDAGAGSYRLKTLSARRSMDSDIRNRSNSSNERKAILGLEQDKIAAFICQTDRTGTRSGIRRIDPQKWVIGASMSWITPLADLTQWLEDRWNDKFSLKLASDLRRRGDVRKPPAVLATHETSCLGQNKNHRPSPVRTRAVIKERTS